jgi:hypothetical protein
MPRLPAAFDIADVAVITELHRGAARRILQISRS